MAHILARKQADGSTRYTAVIRLRRGTTVVHREAKTSSHRGAAEKWAKSREVALENPSELVRAQCDELSLSKLIRWYSDNFSTVSNWQRSKVPDDATREILTNKEVIAVDQDALGIQGFPHKKEGGVEIWFKPLANDAWR